MAFQSSLAVACNLQTYNLHIVGGVYLKYVVKSFHFSSTAWFFEGIFEQIIEVSFSFSDICVAENVKKRQDLDMDR